MKIITAEIITIGDEILYGQTLDTNSHWISGELDQAGIKVIRKSTIGDERQEMLQVFKEALQRADLILITGGLGPTRDDLTKPCLAEFFNVPLVMHETALQDVTNYFVSKGKELSDLNRKQAELPANATLIHNYHGSAPGMWFEFQGKIMVSMPGVPFEMKEMMRNEIIPKVKSTLTPGVIVHRIIHTVGIGESWLSEKIQPWEDQLPEHIRLAYLPSTGQVKLRLSATGDDKTALESALDEQVQKLYPFAGEYIFGFNQTTFAQSIGDLLRQHHKTVAIAESCSGGYVSHMITSIPGASAYFNGSVIPYQNFMKESLLHVSTEILEHHGAVSEPTVRAMALEVRKLFHSDIGLAISGIAGPSGGTADKPVGTVWLALADDEGIETLHLQLGYTREINIRLSAVHVLNLLRKRLVKVTHSL